MQIKDLDETKRKCHCRTHTGLDIHQLLALVWMVDSVGDRANTVSAKYAPAGAPQSIIDRMAKETAAATGNSDVAKKLTNLGFVPAGGTSGEFRKLIDAI
ncbi:hypothetical protein [Cupriavidus sp. CP313]